MLLHAARTLIDSTLHGGESPTPVQLELLRASSSGSGPGLSHEQHRVVDGARIIAFIRADRVGEALAVARGLESDPLLPGDRRMAPESAMSVLGAFAELYIAVGDPTGSLAWSQRLDGYAGLADARWKYRALGLLAASHALNGELEIAEGKLVEMRALGERQGWDPNGAEYFGAIAELVLVFIGMDAERSVRLAERTRTLLNAQPVARSLTDLVECTMLFLTGDAARALALSTRIAQGVSQPTGPGLVRGFAPLIEATILLREGEPLRALAALSVLRPIGRHLICPDALRAVAHLQLGEYREVLMTTSECVTPRTGHNLFFLPLVLLCRSMAHLRLGHEVIALRDAGKAIALFEGGDPTSAFSFLPAVEVNALFDLVERRLPAFLVDLPGLRTALARSGGLQRPAFQAPRLSERERVIAHRLRGAESFPEIARELHVAVGTVKSQAFAIYRKLGVNGRESAVLELERMGFYEA